jgi:hypothetical protein
MQTRSAFSGFVPRRRSPWGRRTAVAVLLASMGAGFTLAMQAPESTDAAQPAVAGDVILLPEILPQFRDMRAQLELEVVMRAAVREHPELIDSPRRDGFYRLDVALNADGSVYRSGVAFYPGQRNNDKYLNFFDLRRILPIATASRMSALILRGESVRGVGIAPNMIDIYYGFLPVNYDPSRAAERVETEVRRLHADLIQPYRNGILNVLTVLLTEDGGIARTHVARKNIEQARAWRLLTDFSDVGVDREQLGPNGTFVMPRDPVDTTTPAPFHFRDPNKDTDQEPILWVRYAWPLRIGESAGGPQLSHVKLVPELQTLTTTEQLASRYCPGALTSLDQPPGRCWIVFTREGHVVRTGLQEFGDRRSFGSELIRLMNPDLKLGVIKSERVEITPLDKHAQLLLAWERAPF